MRQKFQYLKYVIVKVEEGLFIQSQMVLQQARCLSTECPPRLYNVILFVVCSSFHTDILTCILYIWTSD